MHHKSSAHDSFFQWGIPNLSGSQLATSVTTTPQPDSPAKLWAKLQRALVNFTDNGPSPPSPYIKWNPKGLKTSGTDGTLSQGKARSIKRVVLAKPLVILDAPRTSSLKTSLQFHTLTTAHDSGGLVMNSFTPGQLDEKALFGTARKVPKLSLLFRIESMSFGKNSVVENLWRYRVSDSLGVSLNMDTFLEILTRWAKTGCTRMDGVRNLA